MGTKIEWAAASWSPITGCSKISEGCTNCYAERMAKRLKGRYGYSADDPFKVTFHANKLEQPLHWRKPRMIFVCSMGDLFHENIPFDSYSFDKILITMARCPEHTFILLTKRPLRMKECFDRWQAGKAVFPLIGNHERDNRICYKWPLPNVFCGVTAENQKRADERIPILLQIPAKVRFVSVEPMLGPINLTLRNSGVMIIQNQGISFNNWNTLTGKCGELSTSKLDWVIAGCESGTKRRPAKIEWFRNLRDQCVDAGVPFFLKQIEVSGRVQKMPELDGTVWNQTPEKESN